jgi:hypothetical protein
MSFPQNEKPHFRTISSIWNKQITAVSILNNNKNYDYEDRVSTNKNLLWRHDPKNYKIHGTFRRIRADKNTSV